MAITRTSRLHLDFGEAFPSGLYMFTDAQVAPARDFDRSTREQFVQATEDGVPIWQIDCLDPDDQALGRQKAVTVRIVAPACPTLPDTATGPVRPIELERLSVGAYVEQSNGGRPRVAWSFRATGICAPKAGANGSAAAPSNGEKPAEPGKKAA